MKIPLFYANGLSMALAPLRATTITALQVGNANYQAAAPVAVSVTVTVQ